jgi:hypothetical protein
VLFRKKIERACAYCANGTCLDEEQILCTKKGVVSPSQRCRKFTYDPCKRIPSKPKAPDFEKYNNEDYSL